MVRARWASVIVTAGLGLASGCCCCSDEWPWCGNRGCCTPDCGCEVEVSPLGDGPYLGGIAVPPGMPPNGGTTISPPLAPQDGMPTLAPPPRIVPQPQPQAQPTPYTPSSGRRWGSSW